jgi:hypothetical protein
MKSSINLSWDHSAKFNQNHLIQSDAMTLEWIQQNLWVWVQYSACKLNFISKDVMAINNTYLAILQMLTVIYKTILMFI